jgi:hypothetical protein
MVSKVSAIEDVLAALKDEVKKISRMGFGT